jgi:hypothetical protein
MRAFLEGDWDIFAGQYFNRFDSSTTIPIVFRLVPKPRAAVLFVAVGSPPLRVATSPLFLSAAISLHGHCALRLIYNTERRISLSSWDRHGSRAHEWDEHRRRRTPIPAYARITIGALLLLLFGTLVWQAVEFTVHPAVKTTVPSRSLNGAQPGASPWQRDALDSIEQGLQQAQAGDLSATEVAVDRAASMIEVARVQGEAAAPMFFELSLDGLDRVLAQRPSDQNLFEHVTLARIDLAGLRSSQETAVALPAGKTRSGRVNIAAPHQVAADHLVDPTTFKGDYVDATLMPDTSEILLPPASRLFADNVRVENLTFEGASQTLDGVRWHNVTFVNTRLRYEDGELDLQNVHFVRCTFGLPSDPRGARLATAIALGQSTFVIE